MRSLARPPEPVFSYPLPEPHGPPSARGPVACAEATPRRDPHPVETSLRRADGLALCLKAALDRIAVPLARAAGGFVRAEGWKTFCHARLGDHAAERFDRSGKWVRQYAALGEALEALPALEAALTGDDGGVPIGVVRAQQIAKVATLESLAAWIGLARAKTARELIRAVSRAKAAESAWPQEAEGAAEDDAQAPGLEEAGLEDPDLQERVLVKYLVPVPVAAAFEQTLGLHRAVVGQEASVASFIEALVADAMAGTHPPDLEEAADMVPLQHGEGRDVEEQALARATTNWSRLPRRGEGSWALALAGESLAKFLELARRAGKGKPAELDKQIRGLLRLQDQIERRLGRLLCEMADMGGWSRLMFADVEHYAEQRLGVSRRVAACRVRAARGLRMFPLLRQAYEAGAIGLGATLRVLRVLEPGPADEATQRAWIERASRATLKRVKDETAELFRRAGEGTGQTRMPLSDENWLASIRREPGMAQERIARLGRRAVDKPSPDVFLRLRLPARLAADLRATVEAERRRLEVLADEVAWYEPWPDGSARSSVLAARMFSTRCRRVPAWVGLLALLEEFVGTYDDPRAAPKRPDDEILQRDGYRCGAPGCTSRRRLHVHHVVFRSRGGGEEDSNKIVGCLFHHERGVHGGLASCRGKAPLGIRWSLGKDGIGGSFLNEMRLE